MGPVVSGATYSANHREGGRQASAAWRQGDAMRHPVSTIARSGGGERLRGAMSADVVWGAVLPAAPENAGPRASEDPDRVLMATPTRTRALTHEGRPPRGVAGIIGEGRDGTAQALAARPAKHDGPVVAGGMRDGRLGGLGRAPFGGW